MKASQDVGFPTVGEVIHFIYKAAGLLPKKRDATAEFDQQERKNVQKALERLAAEEGDLNANMGELIRQLAFLMAGHVRLAPLNFAIGDVLLELLDIYGGVVREEGTYLSKHDTVRWMIIERWAPAAAVSLARSLTRFGLRPLAAFFPREQRWYLPDFGGDKPLLPLAKVMRWVYAETGTTQTQFHYPERTAGEDRDDRQRDLENAQNWIHDRRGLPSAAALDWTFARAFDANNIGKENDSSAMHRDAMCTALFLGRAITHVAKALREYFGKDFLEQACKVFESTLTLALDEAEDAEKWIADNAEAHGISPYSPELRNAAIAIWNDGLKTRSQQAGAELQSLYEADALNSSEIERMVRRYGPLPVLPAVEWLQRPRLHQVPEGFGEALMEGLGLAKDRSLTVELINNYEAGLQRSGMEALLPWMVPWLRFVVCYRKQDDVNAWHWIEQAFSAARYRAGAQQHQVVNHYIEQAVKMAKRVAIRKGVHWARYIGVEVRWLRDREPTDENLDMMMQVFSRARYPI